MNTQKTTSTTLTFTNLAKNSNYIIRAFPTLVGFALYTKKFKVAYYNL